MKYTAEETLKARERLTDEEAQIADITSDLNRMSDEGLQRLTRYTLSQTEKRIACEILEEREHKRKLFDEELRHKTVERCYDLAEQLARTGDYTYMDEIDRLAYLFNREHPEMEIYISEADDYIMVEDERFDFEYDEEEE